MDFTAASAPCEAPALGSLGFQPLKSTVIGVPDAATVVAVAATVVPAAGTVVPVAATVVLEFDTGLLLEPQAAATNTTTISKTPARWPRFRAFRLGFILTLLYSSADIRVLDPEPATV